MVWIFLLYDGLNQICIGVYLFFVLIYLIFVMCSSVSRFKQMQTETLLMYMMQPSRFNPMVQTPWTMRTFLIWKTLVPLPSTNFTLFEIVNELVSKEEPLYFNPPTLQETLRNPNPRKEAHQIQRKMQQRSTGFISNDLPNSFK
jgi:hypothetical protein